jgi:hypothetical protein
MGVACVRGMPNRSIIACCTFSSPQVQELVFSLFGAPSQLLGRFSAGMGTYFLISCMGIY